LFVEQAGAVVYRRDGAGSPASGARGLRILLVRARRNPTDWIFPKGHIEPGETAGQTAVREAEEEAGVTGTVVSSLAPVLTFHQGDRQVRVHYFLVEYTGEVKPKERREIAWLAPPEALVRLTHESARTLLEQALPLLSRAP
jgi:8-oxo-dGTP pyrophosphatase MutT (NUDIX family)